MPHAPSAALAGLRVLVVEDEFLIAQDLLAILDAFGCVALGPAPTVGEALRLLAAGPPDAALLDMNLRGVRATPVALAAAGVPFATVTAYLGLPEAVFDGVPLVAKPFTPERVGHALPGLARR